MRLFLFFMVVIIVVTSSYFLGRFHAVKEDVQKVSAQTKTTTEISQKNVAEKVKAPPRAAAVKKQGRRKSKKRKPPSRSRTTKKQKTVGKEPAKQKPPEEQQNSKQENPKRDLEAERKQARELFQKAIVNLDSDHVEEALSEFEHAISLDNSLLSKNDKGLLKEIFFRREQAHEDAPEDREKLYNLARAYYLGGRMTKALPLLNKLDTAGLNKTDAAEVTVMLFTIEKESEAVQARLEEKQKLEKSKKEAKPGKEEPEEPAESRSPEQEKQAKLDAKRKEIDALKLKLDSLVIQQDMLADERGDVDRKFNLWNRRYYRDQTSKARTKRIVYKHNLEEVEQRLNTLKEEIAKTELDVSKLEGEQAQLEQELSYEE